MICARSGMFSASDAATLTSDCQAASAGKDAYVMKSMVHTAQAAMQLTPAQQAELIVEAEAMTQRLRGITRRHKALLLDVCRAPLTASGARHDNMTVRFLHMHEPLTKVSSLRASLHSFLEGTHSRRPSQQSRLM